MNWFVKEAKAAEAVVVKTEAELAAELVRVTGEAHIKAVIELAKANGKTLTAAAVTAAENMAAKVVADSVAKATAAATAAVAASTSAAVVPVPAA